MVLKLPFEEQGTRDVVFHKQTEDRDMFGGGGVWCEEGDTSAGPSLPPEVPATAWMKYRIEFI